MSDLQPVELVLRESLVSHPVVTGLPDKPVDLESRHVSWVALAAEPGLSVIPPGQTEVVWVDVDAEWIDQQIAAFDDLTSDGYTPPVLIEHDRVGTEVGSVLQLAKATVQWPLRDGTLGPKRLTLLGAVGWTTNQLTAKVLSREVRYVSPHIGRLENDGRGKAYPSVLREVSIVSAPLQKHMGGTHILASEEAAPTPTPEDRMDPISEKLDTLIALFTAAFPTGGATPSPAPAAPAMPAPPPPAPAPGPTMEGAGNAMPAPEDKKPVEVQASEVQLLRNELQMERRARQKTEFVASAPKGTIVDMDTHVLSALFDLAGYDERSHELVQVITKKARRAPAPIQASEAGEAAQPPGAPSGARLAAEFFASEIGNAAGADTFDIGNASDNELLARAKREASDPSEVVDRLASLVDERLSRRGTRRIR